MFGGLNRSPYIFRQSCSMRDKVISIPWAEPVNNPFTFFDVADSCGRDSQVFCDGYPSKCVSKSIKNNV